MCTYRTPEYRACRPTNIQGYVCCRLREFAQLYDVLKNERNKCVSLIQASTQKVTEVNEKLKIFDNEVEILRTSVAQKEKYITISQSVFL